MNVNSEVTFQIGFEKPPTEDHMAPDHVRGGLRAKVGNTVLTRDGEETTETDASNRYSANGEPLTIDDSEFKGEFATVIVNLLLDAVVLIQTSDLRFDEQVVELPGPRNVGAALLLSYLDEEIVRVGFQNTHGWTSPPLAVTLGKPVSETALVNAAIELGTDYLTYLERTNIDPCHEDIQVKELIETLRTE